MGHAISGANYCLFLLFLHAVAKFEIYAISWRLSLRQRNKCVLNVFLLQNSLHTKETKWCVPNRCKVTDVQNTTTELRMCRKHRTVIRNVCAVQYLPYYSSLSCQHGVALSVISCLKNTKAVFMPLHPKNREINRRSWHRQIKKWRSWDALNQFFITVWTSLNKVTLRKPRGFEIGIIWHVIWSLGSIFRPFMLWCIMSLLHIGRMKPNPRLLVETIQR